MRVATQGAELDIDFVQLRWTFLGDKVEHQLYYRCTFMYVRPCEEEANPHIRNIVIEIRQEIVQYFVKQVFSTEFAVCIRRCRVERYPDPFEPVR